jgi:hypothetical protein
MVEPAKEKEYDEEDEEQKDDNLIEDTTILEKYRAAAQISNGYFFIHILYLLCFSP